MSTSLGIGRPSAGRGHTSHHPRQPSNSLYDSFEPGQLAGFKEAFNMIDEDGDGLISEADLTKMLQQLGQNPSSATISSYFAGNNTRSINFATFLTMFSDRLLSLDPEDEMLEAFACFDEQDSGYVPVAKMRGFLATLGDRMSEEDINRFLSPPFTDKHGNFAYRDFLKVLRITDLDQEKAKLKESA